MRPRGAPGIPAAGLLAMAAVGLPALAPPMAGSLAAQGVQDAAPASARSLPGAYFQRIARTPDFFRLADGWMARGEAAAEGAGPLTGTLPLLVVLALHADSPTPWVGRPEVTASLFDGPSLGGTLTEYYREVSGGRFEVTGEVVSWVRTSVSRAAAVGTSYGLGDEAQVGAFLREAIGAADDQVDFRAFDNDGPDGIPDSGDDDGRVDAVAFEFLEVAASCGGPGIWPHRSRLRNWDQAGPYVSDDVGAAGTPILVDDYIVQSVVDCGGVQVQNASTIAHELGHVLGLPDLYDRSQGLLPEERRWVVGCWSLMSAGSGWGCGPAGSADWVRPTHMSPWEKIRLGWIGVVEVVESGLGLERTLEPVQRSGRVLKIPLESGVPEDSAEYLLVEYRTREGFDRDLPASGVLIYHIDPKIPGNYPCPTCPQTYRVALLEADGNDGLRRTALQGGNRGEAGDAWGWQGVGRLTPSSHPSTRLSSGALSPVTLYRIAVEGGEAHLTLSTRIVPVATLIEPFLDAGASPPSPQEAAYLDAGGNNNGRYDVGDLRAYLKR